MRVHALVFFTCCLAIVPAARADLMHETFTAKVISGSPSGTFVGTLDYDPATLSTVGLSLSFVYDGKDWSFTDFVDQNEQVSGDIVTNFGLVIDYYLGSPFPGINEIRFGRTGTVGETTTNFGGPLPLSPFGFLALSGTPPDNDAGTRTVLAVGTYSLNPVPEPSGVVLMITVLFAAGVLLQRANRSA